MPPPVFSPLQARRAASVKPSRVTAPGSRPRGGTVVGVPRFANKRKPETSNQRESDQPISKRVPTSINDASGSPDQLRQTAAVEINRRSGQQRQVRGRQEIEERLSEVHRQLYQNTTSTLSEESRTALLAEYTALEAERERLPITQTARELTRAEARLARVEHTLSTTSTTAERETELWQERHTLHVETTALQQEKAEERRANTRRERTVRYLRKIPDSKVKAVYFKQLNYYLSDRDRAAWVRTYDWDTLERGVRERFPKAPWLEEAELMLLKRSKGSERERRIARRHGTPVISPGAAPGAVAMLDEARWWVETEGSASGQERAFEIIKSVESWLAPITRPDNMHRHFGKLPFHDQARVFPGRAHEVVLSLVRKFQIAKNYQSKPSIGGWWEVALTTLKASEPYLDVLSGKQALRDTKIPGLHAAMKRGAAVTPLAIAGGGLAGGGLGWAGVTMLSEGVYLYAGRYLFINAPQLYSSATLYGGAVLTGVGLGQQVIDIRAHGLSVADIPRFISNLMPLFFGMAEQRSGSGGSRSSSGSGSTPAKPGPGLPNATAPAVPARSTIQASPPPPPARPPAQTLKALPPPPPSAPAVASSARGPSLVTDAELVGRYAHRPASITAQNPTAHAGTWRKLGGSGAPPSAFQGPDGKAWVSTDHALLAAPGRAGIPPVRPGGVPSTPIRVPHARDGSARKPATQAEPSSAQDIGMAKTGQAPVAPSGADPLAKTGQAPAPLGADPLAKTGAAPAPDRAAVKPAGPNPAAPAPKKPGPPTAEASKASQQSMAPQPRGGSRLHPKDPPQPISREAVERLQSRAKYTVDAENHQKAWKMLGGRSDVAPPAFISEGNIYLDPSRWPPKIK